MGFFAYDQDGNGGGWIDPPAGGGTGGTIPPDVGMGSAANHPDFTGGFRCNICNLDWPVTDPRIFGLAYDHEWGYRDQVDCPKCDARIPLFSNMEPMTVEEAWSIIRHLQFAEYYERTRGCHPDDD